MQIGKYKITKINVDEYEVIQENEFSKKKVVLCGGDFETFLEPLFTQRTLYADYWDLYEDQKI